MGLSQIAAARDLPVSWTTHGGLCAFLTEDYMRYPSESIYKFVQLFIFLFILLLLTSNGMLSNIYLFGSFHILLVLNIFFIDLFLGDYTSYLTSIIMIHFICCLVEFVNCMFQNDPPFRNECPKLI